MAADSEYRKNRRVPWVLGLIVFVLLLVLVLLQSSNLLKAISVETASDTLLLYGLSSLNFIAFVIFGFIFLRNIVKLVQERRSFTLGAKIKTRLLIYFFAISLLPIFAMAVFSYLFMNRAVDRWFTQIPETVVTKSRDVQTQALADQSRNLENTAQMLASVLDGRLPDQAEVARIANAGDLARIEILDQNNDVVVAGGKGADAAQAGELDRVVSLARAGSNDDRSLNDGKGFDASVVPLASGRRLLIVPASRGDESVSQVVDNSLLEFDRLKSQQITVRQIALLTLGVLTFLLIFASTWTAFYIARGLTVPIKALAEGADEVAKGRLGHQVDVAADDELSILVHSFNQMSSRLEENSAALNEGRKYIETVLQTLPTGVISFDAENRVSTINRAAVRILRLENADFSEIELRTLVNEDNRAVLERLIARAKRIGHAAEQAVLRRENVTGLANSNSELTVALIATALPDENGTVLVIEDLSELIAAQRAAAWQEVARRMAHEIKNPLTPIQLSAERIAKRFSTAPAMAPAGASGIIAGGDAVNMIVQEGTETILREVHSLKAMVDEFSRFARLPEARLEPGNINEIIEQVINTYGSRSADARIDATLADGIPQAMIDGEQLKRIFVNLIENSVEALDDFDGARHITVSTRHDAARDLVIAEVSDNGPGIDPRDFQKLFQPYFSTKGRGTGLGLAIVRRIVAEHNGKINAVANQPSGAKFIIEIPAIVPTI